MKKIVIACLFGFGLISAGCNDAAKKPEPGATTAAAPADAAKPADATKPADAK